jgi:hypothetical protein
VEDNTMELKDKIMIEQRTLFAVTEAILTGNHDVSEYEYALYGICERLKEIAKEVERV